MYFCSCFHVFFFFLSFFFQCGIPYFSQVLCFLITDVFKWEMNILWAIAQLCYQNSTIVWLFQYPRWVATVFVFFSFLPSLAKLYTEREKYLLCYYLRFNVLLNIYVLVLFLVVCTCLSIGYGFQLFGWAGGGGGGWTWYHVQSPLMLLSF